MVLCTLYCTDKAHVNPVLSAVVYSLVPHYMTTVSCIHMYVPGFNYVLCLQVANHRVKTYSGGMKRRLSVALSFLGDPSIMFLG